MFSLWLNKIFLCAVMISCLAIIKSLDKNIGIHTASTVIPVVCHQKTFSMKTFRSPSATFHSNQAAISAFRVTEGPSLCTGPTRPSTPPKAQGVAGLSAVLLSLGAALASLMPQSNGSLLAEVLANDSAVAKLSML